MKEWWNNATISAFKRQTRCIIDQYSSYSIEEIGMNLNGLITQGENIADNGGLKQAFRVSKIPTIGLPSGFHCRFSSKYHPKLLKN